MAYSEIGSEPKAGSRSCSFEVSHFLFLIDQTPVPQACRDPRHEVRETVSVSKAPKPAGAQAGTPASDSQASAHFALPSCTAQVGLGFHTTSPFSERLTNTRSFDCNEAKVPRVRASPSGFSHLRKLQRLCELGKHRINLPTSECPHPEGHRHPQA